MGGSTRAEIVTYIAMGPRGGCPGEGEPYPDPDPGEAALRLASGGEGLVEAAPARRRVLLGYTLSSPKKCGLTCVFANLIGTLSHRFMVSLW